MQQGEMTILNSIANLLKELDVATYGKEKTGGRFIQPSVKRFYFCSKKIFELIDELVEEYSPEYVLASDYYLILDSKRKALLELDVLKDRKLNNELHVTSVLEPYLSEMLGLFKKYENLNSSISTFNK